MESYGIGDLLPIDDDGCESTRYEPDIIMDDRIFMLGFLFGSLKRRFLYLLDHRIELFHREWMLSISTDILTRHRIMDTGYRGECYDDIFWYGIDITTSLMYSLIDRLCDSLHIHDSTVLYIFTVLTYAGTTFELELALAHGIESGSHTIRAQIDSDEPVVLMDGRYTKTHRKIWTESYGKIEKMQGGITS